MLSLAFLMHANNFDNKNPHVSPTCRTETNQRASGGAHHLLAAACFGLVLTMKHSYITYSGWFVVYLARRFCCVKVQSSAPHPRLRVAWKRLVRLVQTVSLVMLAPSTVFVAALYKESRTQDTLLIVLLRDWLQQLYTRLFPFQRGLVHDYWAGNVWALYTALLQCGKFLVRQCAASAFCHQTTAAAKLDHWLSSPHLVVTPTVTLVATLVAQLPGLRLAYRAAEQQSNALLLQSFTYTTLVSFLFQFHAHEKAVLTSLIACTIWAAMVTSDRPASGVIDRNRDSSQRTWGHDADAVWSFLWEFTALAVLGILPLLFRPQELLLKLACYIAYLCILQHWSPKMIDGQAALRRRLGAWIIVLATVVQLEISPLHKLIYGRYEFAPLAITSLVCASGLGLLAIELMLRIVRVSF